MPDDAWTGEDFDLDLALAANVVAIDEAWLRALEPDPPFDLVEWAPQNIAFARGSPAPGPFRHETAPYLREILACLNPDHPAIEVSVIKCAQSGGTVVGDIWLAGVLTAMTAPAMAVHPSLGQFAQWAEDKFWPMAEASAEDEALDSALAGALLPRQSRTEGGSTRLKLKWANGSSVLGAGSESPKTLRQHTIRFLFKDDLDGWAENAGGEGDPDSLADDRQITYRELGTSKTLNVSTPLIKGASRIEKKYAASDMRRWYSGCIHCEAKTDFDWEDVIRANAPPFNAHVACPACGGVMEPSDKPEMLRRGLWIATCEIDGVRPPRTLHSPEEVERWRRRDVGDRARYAGFWITGVISRFSNWNSLAEQELAAGDDPDTEQPFVNTKLGRPYEVKSRTPGHEALMARRQPDLHKGQGVYGFPVTTLSVDVQRDGLWYLIKGWDREERSAYLDWGFLAGETAVKGEGAWPKLTEIADRGAPLPGGARLAFDIIVVDTNYNTDAAKAWVGRRPTAIAINGEDGWGKPIIYRVTQSELKASGRKRRVGGVKVWHVGTYPAKSVVVARYGKTTEKFDEAGPPPGYCFFPAEADEALFLQLTAEYVATERNRKTGREQLIWKQRRGENHLFDCDVYALAGLDQLGARRGHRGSWSDERWAEAYARMDDALRAGGQEDLFDAPRLAAMINAPAAAPASSPAERPMPTALQRLAALNKGR